MRDKGFDPELNSCQIEWRIWRGMVEVYCYSKNFPTPIGILWGYAMGSGNTNGTPHFQVVYVFVADFARRKGVLRKMLQWLFTAWSGKDKMRLITTPDGSQYGGIAAMEKIGFTRSADKTVWVLTESVLAAGAKSQTTKRGNRK